MRLNPGTRLGPYEILSQIGSGGMGEVYRARDTRLDRTVAVKVLPPHIAERPEARERLDREARAISALNHPNICTLYDVGHQDGVDYLVMEHLEGETLEARLAKGPLAREQVLRLGVEICGALDRAHRQGVIHRDLKPGNVMLTRTGSKLLDFGLAKLAAPTGDVAAGDISGMRTVARALTGEGMILGTLLYMSPEQLEGKEADARSDLFALGALLYEMLVGRRAFDGRSPASVIAAILSSEPAPMSTLQPMLPPALDRVVRGCLAKDPEDRWQTAHDVMLQLKGIAEAPSETEARSSAGAQRSWPRRLAWALAVAAFLAAAAAAGGLWLGRGRERGPVMRFSVLAPAGTTAMWDPSIAPDGREIVFIAMDAAGKSLLWLRKIESLEAQPLPGTEGASEPFWAPDGRAIGFFAGGALKRIDLPEGVPRSLCDAEGGGGTWNGQGVIVFSRSEEGALYRVSAEGGDPSPVTAIAAGEEAHRWPSFLPDGRHFLYLADAERTQEHQIKVGSLDSTGSVTVASAPSNALYAAPGYLLYVNGGALLARAFDASRLRLSGDPVAVVEPVGEIGEGHNYDFSVSETGTLIYRRENPHTQLAWFDREGNRLGAVGEPDDYVHVELSPDDRQAALEILDPDRRNGEIWLLDLERGTKTRFTFDPEWDLAPIWSPDARAIVFGSDRGGRIDLYEKAADGSGKDELLLKSPAPKIPTSWSPDGRSVVFETEGDLWILPLAGERRAATLVATRYLESHGQISPDGRWLAFVSDESGTSEVYVTPFPGSGGRWRISTAGGVQPRWRRDGREIFYLSADLMMMAVDVKPGASFAAGLPRPLFHTRTKWFSSRYDYAVSRDGRRLLINTDPGAVTSAIDVILNWPAELKK